jgi:hypothetical protein
MALAMAGAFMGLALLLPAHWRRGFLLPSDHSHLGTLVWWLALWGSLGFLTSGTLVLLVGMWGFPPRAVFLAATILLAGVALWRGIAEWPGLLRVERLPLHDSVFIVALRVVAVGAVGLLAWMTLQPWLEIDTLTYHQSVPKAWLNEGRVFGVPFEAHSHWHFLSDVVNVWSFALLPSDTIAPKLLELIRSLLAACAAAGGAAWLYGRRAGLVTGVMVLLFTEMSRYGTTSHVDVGMGLYATVGVLLLAAWLADPRQLRLAVLGSVILGGCAGAKHTGGVTMLAALVVAALIRTVQMMRQVRRPPASHLLVELVALFLPAFLVVLPWLVKNALFTGNPFYPFLSRHFNIREDAAIPLIHFITYYPDDAPLMERLLPGTSQLAAFNSNAALNNANGYVFMTFAAMLTWFFTRPGNGADGKSSQYLARLYPMLALAATVPFFVQAPFFRFHAHLYPLAAMVFVGELDRLLSRRIAWLPVPVFALLVAWAGYHFVHYNIYRNWGPRALERPTAGVTLTPAAVEAYYTRHAPGRGMVEVINRTLGPDDRLLLTFEDISSPLLECRFIPNVPCVMQPAIQTMEMLGWDAARMAAYLEGLGVTHLAIEDRYDPGHGHPFVAGYLTLLHRDEAAGINLYRFEPKGRM